MKLQTMIPLALSVLLPSVGAQNAENADNANAVTDAWLVPIHTQQSDPIGGAYGTWAAGNNYKVKFDDGFTFFPVLGESYPENLPVRWRTQSVMLGDRRIVDGNTVARPHATEWRYELHYPGVTEAYDVRAEHVEQTFVLAAPMGAGDLVVRGRMSTNLTTDSVAADHQGLQFRGDRGEDIVSYGAATVLDAAGRRMPVTTSYDGALVELRVPGQWLATATYPVVLDPIVGNASIPQVGSPNNGIPSYPNVSRDDSNNHTVVSYSRASAGNDYDVWVRVRNDNLSGIGLMFTDITSDWSTRHTSLAWVRGASDWAVAIGRDFPASSAVRVYVHTAGDLTTNSGSMMFLNPPVGSSDQFPSIGGNTEITLNDNAYLVFQRDVTNTTANSEVIGVRVDTQALTFGTERNLHTPAGSYDNERPMVTHSRGAAGGDWVVVWHSLNYANANDDWDVVGQLVDGNGVLLGWSAFGRSGTSSRHKVYPVVDGRDGRYAIAYFEGDNTSSAKPSFLDEVVVQRFDWTSGAPTKQSVRTVSMARNSSFVSGGSSRWIAHDTNTDSHWVLAYRNLDADVYASRIGYTGRVVEAATVYQDATIRGFSPTVCYNDDDYEFGIVYATDEGAENPLRGKRMTYLSALNVTYGLSCPGVIAPVNRGTNDLPYAGSEFFGVRVDAARPMAATWLLAGAGSANIPLPSSMGCTLALDPLFPILTIAAGATDANGDFQVDIPLLDTVTNADLYFQFIQLDAGLLYSSNGMFSRVR